MLKGRFTGDPSHIYENSSEKNSDDEHPSEGANIVRLFVK